MPNAALGNGEFECSRQSVVSLTIGPRTFSTDLPPDYHLHHTSDDQILEFLLPSRLRPRSFHRFRYDLALVPFANYQRRETLARPTNNRPTSSNQFQAHQSERLSALGIFRMCLHRWRGVVQYDTGKPSARRRYLRWTIQCKASLFIR